MSDRSARQGSRIETSTQQTTRSTSRRGVVSTATRSTNSASTQARSTGRGSASTRSTASGSTRSTAAGSTSGPRGRNKRTTSSALGESTSTPAAKRRRGTDSLTRNDIPDIVAAVIQAMPNSNTTTNSPAAGASSQTLPSTSVGTATVNPMIQAVSPNLSGDAGAVNPTGQAVVLPDEEQHHQELGEF